MNIEIALDAKALAGAVKRAALVCYPGRGALSSDLELLRGVRLVVPPWSNVLRVCATDLDTFVEIDVPLESAPAFGLDLVVDPKTMLAAIRPLRGRLLLGSDPEGLTLTGRSAAGFRHVVAGSAGDAFPAFPVPSGAKVPHVIGGVLNALERVAHAMSKDVSRPNLNGALVEERDVVATDGHRLASVPHGLALSPIILPARAVTALPRVLDGETSAWIAQDADTPRLFIGGDSCRVSVRGIDGTFPDYRQVLPRADHEGLRVSCSVVDLDAAVRSVVSVEKAAGKVAAEKWLAGRPASMSAEKVKDHAVFLRCGHMGLSVASRHDDGDDSEDVLVLVGKSGTVTRVPAQVRCAGKESFVSPPYLADAITMFAGHERVDIDQAEELAPLRFAADGMIAIVMPMRR